LESDGKYLMLLKTRLQEELTKTNVKWEIIEQDYVLSWVLEGISQIPELQEILVFKGGTALKKIYFGEYRFSQDLDFSLRNDVPKPDNLDQLVEKACKIATEAVQQLSGENIEFKSDPYVEKRPHPEGQQAYTIQAHLPWHRGFLTKVYVEISAQEIILQEPEKRKIIHPYGELLYGEVYAYPLEEILAEKIRALLQFAKKLHERGWGRSRVRDYYDLWRVLKSYSYDLHLDILPDLVRQKCTHKDIVFGGIADIFQNKLMVNLEQEWESWLSDMVADLPRESDVIYDLKEILTPIFEGD
jgi:uncharacterized protein